MLGRAGFLPSWGVRTPRLRHCAVVIRTPQPIGRGGSGVCLGRKAFKNLDALILAVPHQSYLDKPAALPAMLRKGGILVDIKSAVDRGIVPGNLAYWSL